MNIPSKVAIDKKSWDKLQEINRAGQAVQQQMQMFQQICEKRLADLQGETKAVWESLAAKHSLDLQTVVYDVHPTEPVIVPTAVRLKT